MIRFFLFKYIFAIKFKINILGLMLLSKKVFHLKDYTTVLFDFINLTQVHNFTVGAQDIFTFHRLSVFTVSFKGILHILTR